MVAWVDKGVNMAGQPAPQYAQALLQEVEPILRSIVRHKLHVSLDPTDSQQENQDALELLGDIQVELLGGSPE